MSAGTEDFHCLISDEQIVVSGPLCLQKVVYVYKVKLGQKIKDAYFFKKKKAMQAEMLSRDAGIHGNGFSCTSL